MNQAGEVDSAPAMGALVELVNREKLYKTLAMTLSEMRDRMNSMISNIDGRLTAIEEAGIYIIINS